MALVSTARHHSDNLPRLVREAEGGTVLRVATQDDFDRAQDVAHEGKRLGCFIDDDGQEVFLDFFDTVAVPRG